MRLPWAKAPEQPGSEVSSVSNSPWSTTQWLEAIAGGFVLVGLLLIIVYGLATGGSWWQTVSVGLLTAMAALATGLLLGFLFGVPRYVSSGQFRFDLSRNTRGPAANPAGSQDSAAPPAAPGPVSAPATATSAPASTAVAEGSATTVDQSPTTGATPAAFGSKYTPSTNLAEVSDWLTKLLLGAGLVQLTSLGAPVSALINNVADGLDGGQPLPASGAPQVMAGAILVTYSVAGFLIGYVLTTTWYGERIARLGLG